MEHVFRILPHRVRISNKSRNKKSFCSSSASESNESTETVPKIIPHFMPRGTERVPRGYWKVVENRREFMDRAGKSLGVHAMEDWYKITKDDIIGFGGAGMLQTYYGDSLLKALQEIYSEHRWELWRFQNVVGAFKSDSKENIARKSRDFFDQLASKLFPGTTDHHKFYLWYSVPLSTVAQAGGAAILRANGNSLRDALRLAYPEHEWDDELFLKLPPSYWTDVVKHRALFDTIAERLGINFLEDWYKVHTRQVLKAGANSVLPRYYNHSLLKALRTVYPDHEWLEWRFPRVSAGFWDNIQHQRKYMDWVAKHRLGFEPTDYQRWYRVMYDDVAKHGGYRMLAKFYNYSLLAALRTIYPEHTWEDWRITKVSSGFWIELKSKIQDGTATQTELDQLHSFVKELELRLSIEQPEEWYRISLTQLRRIGAWNPIQDLGGLPSVLRTVYPEIKWDGSMFIRPTKKSAQRELLNAIKKIFPKEEIIEEYIVETSEGDGALSMAPRFIEIDIFIPDLSIGFEFQGRHHYEDVDKVGNQPSKERADLMKARIAAQRGITLISVPFWWDLQQESLENTIHEARSDLVKHRVGSGRPIPSTAPVGANLEFSRRSTSSSILSMTLKDKKLRRQKRPAELRAQAEAEAND